jgi:hypothetical protein
MRAKRACIADASDLMANVFATFQQHVAICQQAYQQAFHHEFLTHQCLIQFHLQQLYKSALLVDAFVQFSYINRCCSWFHIPLIIGNILHLKNIKWVIFPLLKLR